MGGRAMARGVEGLTFARGFRWLALLLLCAAYLQGGLNKLLDFEGTLAEMRLFGLAPEMLVASVVILLELGASAMILAGRLRWLGALGLAAFTLLASLLALRFWEMPLGQERVMATNGFFEHLGLVGGFILVACHDLGRRGG
ncbi:DoxX family protein [Roseomonas sp. E05]|uniref:DoxX family protein n=1 Tax=Roseomonas sp. E05 TaxID=3046310 RepID=UPI0024BA5E59|nr:DoxX family protein [Roseomonas sp. E05]MDJ0388744.1 DoxX family protein [Roseomonas sp. E05]